MIHGRARPPPGEEHWHGAGVDCMMSHLAMLEGVEDGDGTTWLEPVTGEQYTTANQMSRQEADPRTHSRSVPCLARSWNGAGVRQPGRQARASEIPGAT
jgi:hypothetical protein